MTIDYDPEFFADLARMQDRHFWYRGRNRLIDRLLARAASDAGGRMRFLDVGCGTGGVLEYLERSSRDDLLLGMDLFDEALAHARAETVSPLLRASVMAMPFDASLDTVGALDVIEHLDDDVDALRCMRAATRAGGKLLLTVPANPGLWSFFDQAAGHKRRYTRASLVAALEAAGYRVERVGYFMAVLSPLAWIRRRLLGRRPTDATAADNDEVIRDAVRAELRVVPVANEIFAALIAIEIALVGAGVPMPFGTSLFAVATAPQESI